MKSVSKFEAIGIFLSVAAMAIALSIINMKDTTIALAPDTSTQAAGVVVVDESNVNGRAALADALLDATVGSNLRQLVVDDVVVGVGNEAQVGDVVTVNYIGRLQNGQEFDNSYTRGTPFTFTLGEGRVIQGWDQGVVGMKVGGERVLVIPSDLAYGDRGAGPIPGGATLVFIVELLAIN